MLEEFPLPVAMPIGPPSGDFSGSFNAYVLERPYGLREGTGLAMDLSHALVLSSTDDAASDRLNAIIKGRLRFVPATATEPAQLQLQPLPFEQIQLRERLFIISMPSLFIYGNVDVSSVTTTATAIISGLGVSGSDATTSLNEFLLGNRWLTVEAGAQLGRPAVDSAFGGRRRLDLMAKDADEFFLNPAYFLFDWSVIDPSLEGHPLILSLEGTQHRMLFATQSRTIYVKEDGGNVAPFTSPANASTTIVGALGEAQPGDLVIVLDSANYEERVFIPDGVKLTSRIIRNAPWMAITDTTGFPTISKPFGVDGSIVVFQGLRQASAISGFIITGATGNDGHGILVEGCKDVEIVHNAIHTNCDQPLGPTALPVHGGGICVRESGGVAIQRNYIHRNGKFATDGGGIYVYKSKVKIDRNIIHLNKALQSGAGIHIQESREFGIWENQIIENEARLHGGGIGIRQSREITIERTNTIAKNTAGGFGAGIAVMDSRPVTIRNNNIGGATTADGNITTGESAEPLAAVINRDPQGGGGGIGVFDSQVKIADNQILNNEAHRGGGIEFYANGAGVVERNVIKQNRTRNPGTGFLPGGDGGGVAVNPIAQFREEVLKYQPIEFIDNRIEENVAGGDGGGFYATAGADVRIRGGSHKILKNTSRENGGGVRVTFGAKLTISGGEILQNEANLAGGNGAGGGISFRNGMIKIENCQIRQNKVHNFGGGGVSAALIHESSGEQLENMPSIPGVPLASDILRDAYLFTSGEVEITNCNIVDNEARGDQGAGGGLYVLSTQYPVRVRISNATLSPNLAEHLSAAKGLNVVIENSLTVVVNDDDLAGLTPITNFDQTVSP